MFGSLIGFSAFTYLLAGDHAGQGRPPRRTSIRWSRSLLGWALLGETVSAAHLLAAAR